MILGAHMVSIASAGGRGGRRRSRGDGGVRVDIRVKEIGIVTSDVPDRRV